MNAGLILYNLLTMPAFLAGWPYLLTACLFSRRGKWRNRCGIIKRAEGHPIWIHASSVGEMGVISPLIAELKRRKPNQAIAISAVTETGHARARDLFGEAAKIFFFPLDFFWVQAAALSRIKPSLVILVETELWPNLIWRCHCRGIPVMLVNARLSERSLPHYKRFAFLFRPLLNTFRVIACQSDEDAGRYRSLGVRPGLVRVLGNMKYDGIQSPVAIGEKQALRREFGIPADAVVMTAGSTREGEEAMALDAWARAIQHSEFSSQTSRLILAPRHPERFAEVEGLLKERNIRFVKRSQQRGPGNACEFDILLLDTIGELVSAYAAADLAFVGGSLVPVGGHNPLEPAALGLPVVFGPHMFNAKDSAESLIAAGGARQVESVDALAALIREWLNNPQERLRTGQKAEQVVDERRGAARKAADIVV
ncbi:MAG: 3-deoxy-D-manno-octulosonic acid transferase, partial [Candidatus Edwardsbacteria bacterium]|nr:3-deoxy-D-manno-octulosonic acid transferase [Candidatus Edwardsbacteria bacterium]